MDKFNYIGAIKALRPNKSLGQCFLISRDIAAIEAEYARGMNALELGPGMGMLTEELCKVAKHVVAIEKDPRLVEIIKERLGSERLMLIGSDFFSADMGSIGKIDIMVSNIPYNLSSKVIGWLSGRGIPALICIQKEFAEHMSARPNTRSYSKLSVISSLSFKVHVVRNVGAGNFYPKPRVDSSLVYLAPRDIQIGESEKGIISLIMNHKKKRLGNAIVDSANGLGISKKEAHEVSAHIEKKDSRPFQLEPPELLDIAKMINSMLDNSK